jgi:hypothetical protein
MRLRQEPPAAKPRRSIPRISMHWCELPARHDHTAQIGCPDFLVNVWAPSHAPDIKIPFLLHRLSQNADRPVDQHPWNLDLPHVLIRKLVHHLAPEPGARKHPQDRVENRETELSSEFKLRAFERI